MNIILFEPDEVSSPLPADDVRAKHILQVLRRTSGETFDAGLIDGPRGKATLLQIGDDSLQLSFEWHEEPPPLEPISLLVGMPRPQTARKILEELTALGVSAIDFVDAERGEASYATSRLWTTGEWRRHVIAGAQQAFSTRLPRVSFDRSLPNALDDIPSETYRLALDNYEATERLGMASVSPPVVIALGAERGWSGLEREMLRGKGFVIAGLGERVLRVETAAVAAVAVVRARLGSL